LIRIFKKNDPSFGENVISAISVKEFVFEQALIKSLSTYGIEKVNQKFTGMSDDEIIFKSSFEIIGGNKISSKFDDVVKEPLKKLGTKNPKSRLFLKNIFFSKKYTKEEYFIIGSVSKVMIGKETMTSSFDFSYQQLLKKYYGNETIQQRLNKGLI